MKTYNLSAHSTMGVIDGPGGEFVSAEDYNAVAASVEKALHAALFLHGSTLISEEVDAIVRDVMAAIPSGGARVMNTNEGEQT